MTGYTLRLLGVLELRDMSGRVRTPRLAKTQALLAILELARGAPIHRARLQDLLWSDRAPQQGRDSLRKALTELRRCFADGPDNPVQTDGGPVRLDLTRITVDLFTDRQDGPDDSALYAPVLLEGLDIRDPEFNLWLSEARARLSGPAHPVAALPPPPAPQRPVFEIGLLPVNTDAADARAVQLARVFVDQVSGIMDQSGVVRVFDFRWQRTALPDHPRGPDVFLDMVALTLGDSVVLTASFVHPMSRRTVFTASMETALADATAFWIAQQAAMLFDQLCERLVRFDAFENDDHAAAKKVFAAVDRTFRLTNCDLDEAGQLLDQACDMVETSTVHAWNAFLTAFRLEKTGRSSNPDLLERADALARRALELDPHNVLTVALVAHVYGFVLRDMDRAGELLFPLRDKSRSNPMLADTLAMHLFYIGDFTEATQHAANAVQTGRFNPFRYSFTTSLAMCNLMTGDFGPAIARCKAALAQHPVRGGHLYEPTLRTMAAAAGLAGDHDTGRRAYRILSEQGRYSPLDHITSGDAPFPNPLVQNAVKQGMEALNV